MSEVIKNEWLIKALLKELNSLVNAYNNSDISIDRGVRLRALINECADDLTKAGLPTTVELVDATVKMQLVIR